MAEWIGPIVEVPGFPGTAGAIIGAFVDPQHNQCIRPAFARGNTWVWVTGLGTGVVEVFLVAYVDTEHECPIDGGMESFFASGKADLLAELGLKIVDPTGNPGDSHPVYYAWSGFTRINPDPERDNEDKAEVRNVFITLDSVPLMNNMSTYFYLLGGPKIRSRIHPGAGLGGFDSEIGETVWIDASLIAEVIEMQQPGRHNPRLNGNCWETDGGNPNHDFSEAVALFRIVLSLDGDLEGIGSFGICEFQPPCQTNVQCPVQPNQVCFPDPNIPGGHPNPGCDDADCCERVCSMCGFERCCTDSWDIACMAMAELICSPTAPLPPSCPTSTNVCFLPSEDATPGCDDDACCETVCQIPGFASCCMSEWTWDCAIVAAALCPGGTLIDEGPCDLPNFNPGCDGLPPDAFINVACGDVICGSSWAANNDRDTDWYRLFVEDTDCAGFSDCELDITIVSDMPLVLTVYEPDCNNLDVLTHAETFFYEPGVGLVPLHSRRAVVCFDSPSTVREFYFHVTPATVCGGPVTDGYPCNDAVTNDYNLFITCRPDCTERPFYCGNPFNSPNNCDQPANNPQFDPPGCSNPECCEAVCRIDPTCCQSAWDSHCAGIALTHWQCQCPPVHSACLAATGSCFASSADTGCVDASCCNAVCQIDSDCCDVEWTDACVLYARAVCTGGSHFFEPEPCGSTVNDGCLMNPPAFTPIVCGDAVSGTIEYIGVPPGDTDWYEISHPGGLLQWAAYADFSVVLEILGGPCGSLIQHATASGPAGSTVIASADLPPGNYLLMLTFSFADPAGPCGSGSNDYVAHVLCAPSACANATNNCYLYSAFPGCNDPFCCAAVCQADPFCCNVEWDNYCVGPVGFNPPSSAVERPECVGCGDPGNDCCAFGAGPYCDDPLCCVVVCDTDPFCCEVEWDPICTNLAQTVCSVCLAPANDNCASAEPVTPSIADVLAWSFDNVAATTDGPPEACGGFAGDVAGNSDSDVWFEFVSPCAQTYTFSITPQGGGPESYLAVYEGGCPQTGGTLVGCDSGVGGAAAEVKTIVGETYIIRAGSPPTQQGDFDLAVIRPCPPDLNNDGWVDGGDLLHLLSGWGLVTPLTVCMDFNHDGVVDGADLLYMLSWWGQCP